MGVYQHRGKWISQTPPSLGRKAVSFDTEQEARADYDRRTATQPEETTLGPLMETWLASHLLKESTREQYGKVIKRSIHNSPYADAEVSTLRPMHVEKILTATASPSSTLNLSKILSVLFAWCEINEYTTHDIYRRSNCKNITKSAKLKYKNNKKAPLCVKRLPLVRS